MSTSDSGKPISIAALISGGGRTVLNLQQQIDQGRLSARIVRVISSRSDVAGIGRARDAGLEVVIVDRKRLTPEAFQQRLTEAVGEVDLVCMAGFLSLWRIPDALRWRVMNIHPALLPEFGGKGMYGHHVHEAVIAANRRESGCTVHFCDNEYDNGPMIVQRRVDVLPSDTPDELAARVFEQECIAYPEAVDLFSRGMIHVVDGQVVIDR